MKRQFVLPLQTSDELLFAKRWELSEADINFVPVAHNLHLRGMAEMVPAKECFTKYPRASSGLYQPAAIMFLIVPELVSQA